MYYTHIYMDVIAKAKGPRVSPIKPEPYLTDHLILRRFPSLRF